MDLPAKENKLRPNMPPLPTRIAALPIDARGYPVPWFVAWVDGKPEFRAADARKWGQAIEKNLCWTCGQPLGRNFVFVIGPMCAINRVSSEPPSHRDCAEFSAKACPFLSMPKMVRRENDLPEGVGDPGGFSIKRKPGVILLWNCRDYKIEPTKPTPLFRIGEPTETLWYAEGRLASRDEILHSIETGLPFLLSACDQEIGERRQKEAREQLEQQRVAAMRYLPAA